MADTKDSDTKDYGKLDVQEGQSGTTTGTGKGSQNDTNTRNVGRGTLPTTAAGSGTPPGGMNISSSTVTSAGTTGGGTPGAGSTTDRGDMPTRDSIQQSGDLLRRNAGGDTGGETASTPQVAPGGPVKVENKQTRGQKGQGGPAPLSPEEAAKIDRDAKSADDTPQTPGMGNQPSWGES